MEVAKEMYGIAQSWEEGRSDAEEQEEDDDYDEYGSDYIEHNQKKKTKSEIQVLF